ncbi:hypothetical protein FKW77_006022 [Venturia effusa]|uniref:Transcription factor domain-containing protein n=1 Tax=Venturia effusa TaxID=50376 RepID=A0A517L7G3_9PEZI|nr:hypothetical protein FKW77_006022 [Venturia effusa]
MNNSNSRNTIKAGSTESNKSALATNDQALVRAGPADAPAPAYILQTDAAASYPTPPPSSSMMATDNRNGLASGMPMKPSIPKSFIQPRPSDEGLYASTRSTEQFLKYFVHGINFVPSLGDLVSKRVTQYPDLVNEGLLACAGAVFRCRNKLTGFDDVDMARSAIALRKLRYAPVSVDKLEAILTLGNLLATYELLTSSQTAHAITRFTLSLVQPLYHAQPSLKLPTELISLCFVDTVECLVRREIPVIKIPVESATLIDRYAGLLCPLLPVLYELCEIGNTYALGGPKNEQEKRLLADHINSLDNRLSSWRPLPPPGFASQFNTRDSIFLLTQARVYRAAGLLILHRLQHPFGDDDNLGRRMSFFILSESSLCVDLLSAPNTIPKTLFPWMIAGVELVTPEERQSFLAQVPAEDREIMALPISRMKEFCKYVWQARDKREGLSWFDLVATAPPFSVMP